MKDYSDLAKDSMWPTSQAGGNMLASSELAMTAPGSQPVDNLNARMDQMVENPTVDASNAKQIEPGTSGKPQASDQTVKRGAQNPGPPRWVKTVMDEVERDDSGATAPRQHVAGADTVPLAGKGAAFVQRSGEGK